jgi:hypothetical protein
MVARTFFRYSYDMAENESTADAVYKWTTRGLYTAAIALNLWYLMEQYRNTPEGNTLLAKFERVVERAKHPFYERKKFNKMANETLVEAWIVVDEANKNKDEN